MTTTMTVEAALIHIAGRVATGKLCWRCGLATGADLHPVAVSGRVEHVDDPVCTRTRGTLIRVRDQLAAIHKAAA